MDLSRAYQEVKSLPDEALTRELEQPSGMVPGYLVMAELEDRKALRASASQPESKTSMKEELLQGIGSVPGYSSGGLVSGANPFYAQMQAQMNPQYAASLMQEQMTKANGGYFPLNPPNVPGQPQAPAGLGSLVPGQSAPAQRPYAKGGQVEKPDQKMVSVPVVQPSVVEVNGNRVAMPSLNSGLMRSDMQGWQLARGMIDWELPKGTYTEVPAAKDKGTPLGPFEEEGMVSAGPLPLPVGHDPREKSKIFAQGIAGLGRR